MYRLVNLSARNVFTRIFKISNEKVSLMPHYSTRIKDISNNHITQIFFYGESRRSRYCSTDIVIFDNQKDSYFYE